MIRYVLDTLQKFVFIAILSDDVTTDHDFGRKNHFIDDKLSHMTKLTHKGVHRCEGCR